MNKKFFTLIAGFFMLAASLGTHAQTITPGDPVGKLPKDTKDLYQLSATIGGDGDTRVLSVDADGNLWAYKIDEPIPIPSEFGQSLWCVNVIEESEGAIPKFEFTNRPRGYKLAVSEEDALKQDEQLNLSYGNLTGWGFSRTYENNLQQERVFSIYYAPDKVLVLKLMDFDTGEVGVKEFNANDLEPGGAAYANDSVLKFTVWKPKEIILNATDFNKLLGTDPNGKYQKLTFKEDKLNTALMNPWSEYALTATDVPVGPTGWLKFEVKDPAVADHKWLRVDTAHTGDYGTRFLKFAFGPTPNGSVIENQYYFQLTYYVSTDSLAISVKQAIFKPEAYDGLWRDVPATTNPDSLHIKLQDLSKADDIRIITVGTKPVSTRIELGIGGCAPTGRDLTSIDNDLYTIYDSKTERYLIVPVYTDTVNGSGTAPKWVTLPANVDPKRIPAYQWVVEKTRSLDPDTISPIRITNREFPDIKLNSPVQLKKSGAVDLPANWGGKVAKSYFKAVPPKEKGNSYLGYKYLSENDARFNTYVFNYLHEFDASKYLDVKKIGTDSSLYVAEGKTQFQLIPYYKGAKDYGYAPKTVTGLAQLKKLAYIIRVKDVSRQQNTGKYITINSEDRYVVNGKLGVADTAVFLLKTNNTKKDGKGEPIDYYALLDTASQNTTQKVGVDDNSLWAYVQVQKETRTSAFSVLEWSEPVYRRFDGDKYGYKEVQEPINQETPEVNTPVWLKFTKVNNYGKEFLFENSPLGLGNGDPNSPPENDYRQLITDKSISFLGLYNISQYPERGDLFNYTFYVDTAYVARPITASVNNEYTPKPQYLLAINPEIKPADTIFYQESNHTWTSKEVLNEWEGEVVKFIRPEWTRGYYVFNAQDSIGRIATDNYSPRNADYVGKFLYGAEYTTRLAFVDGIHLKDTFYVLPARFKDRAIEITLENLYAIPAYHKHYLGENTHYKTRWSKTGVPSATNLSNDKGIYNDEYNGKSMVFQFRLVDPENNRNFLIESQQADGTEVAPQKARWLKIQNGVPVITDPIDWAAAVQNGAEIFDVLPGEEGLAVGNEAAPAVSSVKVVSEAGAVSILNAAGKQVTISNLLGQTVAATAITSDNARIALPKGIVIVAVEGEAAVKAIVK